MSVERGLCFKLTREDVSVTVLLSVFRCFSHQTIVRGLQMLQSLKKPNRKPEIHDKLVFLSFQLLIYQHVTQ